MKEISHLEVKEIFKSRYLIPIYQRNYAWSKDEIEMLLDDIKSNDDGYFIGSLVVRQKDGVFEVIDGQQRLTTIFLILRYLKHEIKGKLEFEARQKSNETLEKICNDNKWSDLPSSEIVSGFKIIKEYFQKNAGFKDKILKAQILRVPVPNDADLNHFFEIMNTRGEQLEAHQIAKAKILKKLEEKDRKIAALVWDACADMDRYVQMSFEKKLREQIFGDEWNKICDENKLFEIPIEDSDGAEVRSLSNILENENLTSQKIVQDENENKRFSSIINFPNFLLQANAAMSNNTSSSSINELLYDKKLIDNLKKHFDNSENAKNFIYNLLKFRFLFDKFIIKTDENDDEKWSLKMLKKYSNNKVTFSYVDTFDDSRLVVALQSCLRITYTSPRAMEWIFTLLKQLDENKKADDIQEILEQYTKEKVKNALEQSTSYPMCERIVLAYLDYILYKECIVSTRNSEPKQKLQNAFEAVGDVNLKNLKEWEFKFRDSIEHFYPQNPSGDSIERMNDDEILNSFGNLALVTTSGNSKFSNLAPLAKRTTYPNIITQSLKLILMSACIDGDNLDKFKQAISEHEKEMLTLLLSDIECKSGMTL
nr:DUF262 domain-containing HNH endonuclease family protein [uncultured Campylobacter sp.]